MSTTVILPTYNESGNLKLLVPLIKQALPEAEVLVVDDNSPDGTASTAEQLGCKVLLRKDKRGLSSAVIDGIAYTNAHRIVVMDADLQHPPEILPKLVAQLDQHDIVVASRFVPGGSSEGLADTKRHIVSKVANLMSLPIAPKVKDRMTGYFAFNRACLNGAKLNPLGFKILLELLAKADYKSAAEVPMVFGTRKYGETKLSSKVMKAYIKQLISLYRRLPLFKFAVVGAIGTVVKLTSMYVCVEYLHLHYMIAYFISFVLAVTSNYTWNSLWTFKQRASTRGMGKYVGVSLISLCFNETLIYILTGLLGVWYMASTAVAILIAFLMNYTLSRRWVWRKH